MDVIDLTLDDDDVPLLPSLPRAPSFEDDDELQVLSVKQPRPKRKREHNPEVVDLENWNSGDELGGEERDGSVGDDDKNGEENGKGIGDRADDGGNGEDLTVVGTQRGVLALADYAHMRADCVVKEFVKGKWHEWCEKCFCYICDIPVGECKEWSKHCKAIHSVKKWRDMRQKKKAKMPVTRARTKRKSGGRTTPARRRKSSECRRITSGNRCSCIACKTPRSRSSVRRGRTAGGRGRLASANALHSHTEGNGCLPHQIVPRFEAEAPTSTERRSVAKEVDEASRDWSAPERVAGAEALNQLTLSRSSERIETEEAMQSFLNSYADAEARLGDVFDGSKRDVMLVQALSQHLGSIRWSPGHPFGQVDSSRTSTETRRRGPQRKARKVTSYGGTESVNPGQPGNVELSPTL